MWISFDCFDGDEVGSSVLPQGSNAIAIVCCSAVCRREKLLSKWAGVAISAAEVAAEALGVAAVGVTAAGAASGVAVVAAA